MLTLAPYYAAASLVLHLIAAFLASKTEGSGAKVAGIITLAILISAGHDVLSLLSFDASDPTPATFQGLHSLVGPLRVFLGAALIAIVRRGQAVVGQIDEGLRHAVIVEEVAARAERSWRTMFERAPDGYILMELDGTLLRINQAAEKLSGWSGQDAVGKTLFEMDVIAAEDLELAVSELEALAEGKPAGPSRYRLTRPDGSQVDIESLGYPVEMDDRVQVLTIFRDRTPMQEAEQALARSRARLEEAQLIANLGTWEYDVAADAVWFSNEVQHFYGSSDESRGRTLQEALSVIDAKDLPRVRKSVEEVIAGTRKVLTEEYMQHTPDGRSMRLRMKARPNLDDKGKVVRVLGVSQDISEIREAEKEIRALNTALERRVSERTADLEHAISELEAFSYSVSHDLRGPLRTIAGFADLLRDKEQERLDEESLDWLSRMRSSAVRLSGMIDNLLQLSRFTRVEPEWTDVNLATMARSIVDELRSTETERDIELRFASPEEQLMVQGDEGLLHVVLQNLIGNSWKFTSGVEEPIVEIGCTREDGEKVWYVRDNGAGFDAQHKHKLFKPFQRLHGVHEFDGSGIGLATVERIIHRHGGRIWAEGRLREGATFWFTLGEEQAPPEEPRLPFPRTPQL